MRKNKEIIYSTRKQIDKLTEELVLLLVKRQRIVAQIFKIKESTGMSLKDRSREKEIVRFGAEVAKKYGVDPLLVKKILKLIILNNNRK